MTDLGRTASSGKLVLSPFPPPLRGRVREGGKPQTPAFVVPPSPTLPRKGGEGRARRVATWLFDNT
jgi:hypothetical protein